MLVAVFPLLGLAAFRPPAFVSAMLALPRFLPHSTHPDCPLHSLGGIPDNVPGFEGHSKWAKKCGLPVFAEDEFRCTNGTFLGSGMFQPIRDIDCYFSLRALRDGIEYDLNILPRFHMLSNGTNLPFKEENRSILAAPFFLPRWRLNGSDFPVFSFRKSSALDFAGPGMIYSHLAERDDEIYRHRHSQFEEIYWGLPLVLNWIHMEQEAGGYISISPGSPSDNGTLQQSLFSTSLQYQCIQDQPRLTLMPRDGEMFFDLRSSPDAVEFDGLLQFPIEFCGHDLIAMSHPCEDFDCRLVWRMGPRRDMPKQFKELHIIVDLIGETSRQSPKPRWTIWKSAPAPKDEPLKRALDKPHDEL
ncbi:uncharacterized protein PAC_14924 [Phialocephala subalpina]|uniref:Uncharacterized protein n=1 Tax=Phialocephala subalpina TaxID=576137 RepID=A0A1L7XJ27_9HELO|nr:uncharacterized protein PAC_14924 [Phialocephala subalpina]